jgi:hypothetical protein
MLVIFGENILFYGTGEKEAVSPPEGEGQYISAKQVRRYNRIDRKSAINSRGHSRHSWRRLGEFAHFEIRSKLVNAGSRDEDLPRIWREYDDCPAGTRPNPELLSVNALRNQDLKYCTLLEVVRSFHQNYRINLPKMLTRLQHDVCSGLDQPGRF